MALEFNERTEEEGRFVSENQTTFQLDLAEIGEIAVDTTGHVRRRHSASCCPAPPALHHVCPHSSSSCTKSNARSPNLL